MSIATPSVVLWEPQDPINTGAVIRACLLCDVPDLCLVRPAFEQDDPGVRIAAPHSGGFRETRLRTVDDWDGAARGVERMFAFSARRRGDKKRWLTLEQACDELEDGAPTSFVFGREDHGLPNEVIDRCDAYVVLDTSDAFRSFNLAQAVMVSVHRAFGRLRDAELPERAPRAERAAVERMLATAESGLDAIGFFKGDQRQNVLAALRRIVYDAAPTQGDLATLWAVFAELERIGDA